MIRVLAQKMTGSYRMCASCSAVTKTGYLVKRGGAELFVCQSCLTAKFGTDYQLVRSLEPEPPRPVVQPRPVARPRQVEPRPHPAVRPRQVEPRPVRTRPETGRGRVLRELAALVNRGIQILRAGLIVSLLLLLLMFGAKEQPAIRPPYYVQYQLNKVERQAVRLEGSILKTFTKERSS